MIRFFAGFAAVLTLTQFPAEEPLAHLRTEFHFTLDIPYASAAPLFGALAEQKWEKDWRPRFLFPIPPADEEGAVFRVDHGPSHMSVWVNTVFDLPGGHVQYVYILNQAMLTRIDIRLAKDGPAKTGVTVAYERTALEAGANAHVKSFAQGDADSADSWKPAIEGYWKAARESGRAGPGRPTQTRGGLLHRTIHCLWGLYTTLSHPAPAKCNPALMQKFVEKRLCTIESAGIRTATALKEESPLGGCAAGVANLGGGGHPVAQASLDNRPRQLPFISGTLWNKASGGLSCRL